MVTEGQGKRVALNFYIIYINIYNINLLDLFWCVEMGFLKWCVWCAGAESLYLLRMEGISVKWCVWCV